MIDIYYPYVHELAKGEELRYSLRSLEKYADFDYQVWIVGNPPPWVCNVNVIPHTRNEDVHGTATYDAIEKLKLFLAASESDHFIRMYDDIYFLQHMTLEDMKVFYTIGDYTGRDPDMQNNWGRQLKRTLEILREKKLGQHNTESHLPEYFSRLKMNSILTWFEPEKERLLTSTLYSNFWKLELQPVLGMKIKAGFYGDTIHSYNITDPHQIREICASHRFLNHNDAGYTKTLQQVIRELFPDKSKFE